MSSFGNSIETLKGLNHKVLIFCVTIFCFYLLSTPLYLCFVKKPTLVVESEENFIKKDFPSITICPEPKINISAAKLHGYRHMFAFSKGRIFNTSRLDISWNGKNGSSIKNVIKDISIIKNKKDCPMGSLQK